MVTTVGWGCSDLRHLFCFTLLLDKACMYHNHIPLMYIFNSPANECWVSFPFKFADLHQAKPLLYNEHPGSALMYSVAVTLHFPHCTYSRWRYTACCELRRRRRRRATTECVKRRRERHRPQWVNEIRPAANHNKGSRQRNRETHEMARPRSATKPPWARPLRTVPVTMSPVVNIGTTDKQGTTRKSTDGSVTSERSSRERSTRTVMTSRKMSTDFGRCGTQPPIRKQ